MVIQGIFWMLLVQSIPFWVMLIMTLINIKIKKKFFCISTLTLTYLTLTMLGSMFMVIRPRTGWPYVRLDAVLFLSVCYMILAIPALLFKDSRENDKMELLHVSDQTAKKISTGLIIMTVPAAVYAAVIAIPDMIKFFQMGGNRGAFRNQLTNNISGFSSISQFLMMFGLTFCLIAIFWVIYCVIFQKIDKRCIILLTLGAMGQCILGCQSVSRSAFFLHMVYVVICVILLLKFAQQKYKKGLKKYAIVVMLLFLVPFIVISATRFKKGLVYSIGSYFATGPYSFSADYAARVEGNTKPLNGYLTIGWHQFVFDKIAGTNHYKNAEMYYDNYFYGGDSKKGTSPEIDQIYRRISGSYSTEFSTTFGFWLKDWPLYLVPFFFAVISAIFCLIFYFDRKLLWQTYFASIYFYILLTSTMYWSFPLKRKSVELFLIIVFGIFLYVIQKKETQSNNAAKTDLIDDL